MLYRFELELSDIDRGVYEALSFRMAQHPSETGAYLLSRLLAYALNYQPNIEFSPSGLNDPDEPAIRVLGMHGEIDLWIDIGNPSTTRLHKASKASKQVMIYTYKRAANLIDSIDIKKAHRIESIKLYEIEAQLLERLESKLEKTNRWSLLHQQGRVDVNTGTESFGGEIKSYPFV